MQAVVRAEHVQPWEKWDGSLSTSPIGWVALLACCLWADHGPAHEDWAGRVVQKQARQPSQPGPTPLCSEWGMSPPPTRDTPGFREPSTGAQEHNQ